MKVIPFIPRPNLDNEKKKLIDMAMQFGLTDQRTIDQSHRVDELVIIEQRRRYRCYRNMIRLASACR